jgi:hypothetical protein
VILGQPIPCLSRRPVRGAVVLALAGSCWHCLRRVHLSAVFWSTGESTPNLGPGIFTSDSGDSSDTHTSAAKQQVLAGLPSIDLCPSGLCRHWQRRSEPSLPRAPTPAHACTKASRAVLERATSSNRRRTASRAVSLSTDCRRGCVTASGGG